ncbi:hypothetical protein D3C73_1105860 [compost metagenome]
MPAPIAEMIARYSSFFRISASLAFSGFIGFPLSGRIAWIFESRPCLAEPPAESPSTINSSLRVKSLDCAGVSLPPRLELSLRFLPVRISSRALRAASLAREAWIAFLISV